MKTRVGYHTNTYALTFGSIVISYVIEPTFGSISTAVKEWVLYKCCVSTIYSFAQIESLEYQNLTNGMSHALVEDDQKGLC